MRIVIVEKDNTPRTREAAARAAFKLATTIVRPVEVALGDREVKILPWDSEKQAIEMVEEFANERKLQAV